MNFIDAVKAMKKGKKVKRKDWSEDSGDTPLEWAGANCCSGEDFEATDWEIVEEEKKTLSDKAERYDFTGVGEYRKNGIIQNAGMLSLIGKYDGVDVKKSIKEFTESIEHMKQGEVYLKIRDKAKEIFGDKLLS